jgi:hypothetical protein
MDTYLPMGYCTCYYDGYDLCSVVYIWYDTYIMYERGVAPLMCFVDLSLMGERCYAWMYASLGLVPWCSYGYVCGVIYLLCLCMSCVYVILCTRVGIFYR